MPRTSRAAAGSGARASAPRTAGPRSTTTARFSATGGSPQHQRALHLGAAGRGALGGVDADEPLAAHVEQVLVEGLHPHVVGLLHEREQLLAPAAGAGPLLGPA